jgi:hypothetical protein
MGCAAVRHRGRGRKAAWTSPCPAHDATRCGAQPQALFDDVPESVRSEIDIHLVSTVAEVLALALSPAATGADVGRRAA